MYILYILYKSSANKYQETWVFEAFLFYITWKNKHKSINILQATLFRVELGAIYLNPTEMFGQVILVGPRKLYTPPETNIAPKNRWLEYYFPIGEAYFQGLS